MGKSTFQPLFCCQKQGETALTVLTSHIEVDQPLILARFVLGGTFVYDGNTGVADVKPAHCLQGGGGKKKVGEALISEEEIHISQKGSAGRSQVILCESTRNGFFFVPSAPTKKRKVTQVFVNRANQCFLPACS